MNEEIIKRLNKDIQFEFLHKMVDKKMVLKQDKEMITGKEPASPMGDQSCREPSNGITIRQQFAMAAMQGLCSYPGVATAESIAEAAVSVADALITELNKTEK